MALDFPASPNINDTYTFGGVTWTYDGTTWKVLGRFQFTSSETDPVFTASPASSIVNQNITNWNDAHGWGDHASAGYLSSLGNISGHTDVTIATLQDAQILRYSVANGKWENWTPNYLNSYTETDTLETVTGRGGTTSSNLTFGGNVQFNNNCAFGSDKVLNFGPTSNGRILYVSATNSFDVRVPGGAEDLKLGAGTAVRITNENGLTDRAVFTSSGLDLISGDFTTTGKLYYSNNFADITALNAVSPTTYHGMFAHVHAEGHGYFAHAGAWTQLLDTGSSLGELVDVDLSTAAPTSGQVLKYDGSNWVPGTDTTGGGGGGGANVTISDTAPGSANAGDLWWESDKGRLKIYYNDTDSTQWVDASPPLGQLYENIDGVVSANGFKFRTNPSSPPTGTLGELRQINNKPYFYDGTTWQEFIFANASVTTIPAETDWDQVLIRSNFDNDANDFRFGATGDLQHYSGLNPATLVASPSVFGTNSLRCTGNGVKYTHRSEYDFTGTWTIEFWIYFDSANISGNTNVGNVINNGQQEIISKSNAGQTAGGWSLSTNEDNAATRQWRFKYNDVVAGTTTSVIIESLSAAVWAAKYLNNWMHVALTRDSNGALHLYTNGRESSITAIGTSFANDIDNNGYDICIGGGQATSTKTFDGYIDDLRITRDVRYVSESQSLTPVFTPPTTAHPVSGSTTTYTPPATSSAGSFTLGASPAWTGTLGVTVAQQSSGNYRLTFANAFTNTTDYYVFTNHMDYTSATKVFVTTTRSTGHIDFSVYREGDGTLVDIGSIAVQIIAH